MKKTLAFAILFLLIAAVLSTFSERPFSFHPFHHAVARTAGCLTDVDDNDSAGVTTDVTYLARHLLNFAQTVPPSFRAGDPLIPSDETINAVIDGAGPDYDVDGNGTVGVTTDITYIARRLLNFAQTVPPSFRAGDPSIPSDETINAAIDVLCPGGAENQAPQLDAIGPRTVPLGTTLNLQLSATDPNGEPLHYLATPLPLPANASLQGHTGLFTFTPDETQVGDIDLSFVVSDGELSDTEAVAITVPAPDPAGITAVTGRILDTNDFVEEVETPVVGATVSLLGAGIATTTDGTGQFTLNNVPAGSQILDIDSSTANPAPDGAPYAGFREELGLIAKVTNTIERPLFLPRIAVESLTQVDPGAVTMVTNPTLEITLTVPAHTAKNPDGTDFTGQLSISPVPQALTPASLPDNLGPGLVITIQPVGVTFATPVPITFPNTYNLTPGSETDIWSLDPESGGFTVVGTGLVSADGTMIETMAGGVRAADWHFELPPGPPGSPAPEEEGSNQDPNDPCDRDFGSRVTLYNGCLKTDITLPAYVSLSEARRPRLVYKSNRAHPHPVIPFDVTIPLRSAVPARLSYDLTWAA